MGERLKKNICELDDYVSLSTVKDLSTCWKNHIGDSLEYACQFWTRHLLKVPSDSSHIEKVQDAIDRFFTTCLLSWIEVLSIMGNLNVGVYALNDIQKWYKLVSYIHNIYQGSPYLLLVRQDFPICGGMTVSASSWNTLM